MIKLSSRIVLSVSTRSGSRGGWPSSLLTTADISFTRYLDLPSEAAHPNWQPDPRATARPGH
jgi:hypothetical protein